MFRLSVLMDAAVVLEVQHQVFAGAALVEMPSHREDADDGVELLAIPSPHLRVAQRMQEVGVDTGTFPEVVQGVAMSLAFPVLVPPVHFQALALERNEMFFIERDVWKTGMADQLADSLLQLIVFEAVFDVPQDDSRQARHQRCKAFAFVEALAAIDDDGFLIERTEVLFHEILRLETIIHPTSFLAFCQGMAVCGKYALYLFES